MRSGAPRRNVPRPEGRRNLSTIAEASGIPKEYRFTKYEKGNGLDRMWLEKREVTDRTCPCCGAEGHVNGHYRRKVWHLPFRGGSQLVLLLDQVRLRCTECGRCWSDGHDGLVSEVSSPHDRQPRPFHTAARFPASSSGQPGPPPGRAYAPYGCSTSTSPSTG